MAGIVSYGSYIPYRRLKRAAIAEVLGVAAAKGERSVASFDEDSVSMAVEAARDAMRGVGADKVRTLLFATSTPPYAEKLNAAIVGAAGRIVTFSETSLGAAELGFTNVGAGTGTRIDGATHPISGIAIATSSTPRQTNSFAETLFTRNAPSAAAAKHPSTIERAAGSAIRISKLELA